MTPERIAELRERYTYTQTDRQGRMVRVKSSDMHECLDEIERMRTELNDALQEVCADRDNWERTARRYAAEAGWDNSDYLEPDTEDDE